MVFSGARNWVYAQSITGKWMRIHQYLGVFQLAVLFGLPWLTIKGNPALLFDLPARRMFILGATYTPRDSIFLLILLLLGAFALFFFTTLFGRLWCGYACPQTVFLEDLIRPVERWIEGDRLTRMRRDERASGTFDWAWRKGLKFTAYAVIAVALSMGFQAFFAGAPEIWVGEAGPADYSLVAAYSAVLFFDFAWFREQFCNYLCPYARFQGVMMDDESLVVAYDEQRGEPRGKGAKDREGCINCGKCVHVCPAGIDIRDGFQLECISCGRCIDACETVLPKLGIPNLIGYHTIAETEGRESRLLRPRTVLYGGIMAVLSVALVAAVMTHNTIEATVNRLPGPLYTLDADGMVRNTYMVLMVNNETQREETFTVTVDGLQDAEVTILPVTLAPTERRTVPLIVRQPLASGDGSIVPITVTVTSDDGVLEIPTTFKTVAP